MAKRGKLSVQIPMSLSLVTTTASFKKRILKAMQKEITKKLSSKAFQDDLRRDTKRILRESLMRQPEYLDMVAHDGKLRRELGVVDSTSAMDSLVRDWVNSTHVKIANPRIVGSMLVGSLVTIRAIQADYEDVINRAYASYITEDGDTIPWLEWLLKKGQSVLVTNYVVFRPNRHTSASRTATNTIMKKTAGGAWGVPEEYSGTLENNFATRAVMDAVKPIEDLIIRQTRRRL